jgi:MFS family permease
MQIHTNYLSGMKALTLISFGQFISILGTGLTQFALILWAWRLTGEATVLTLLAAATFTPSLVLGPIAGALIDRWNRKWTMMLSDLAAGFTTLVIFFLYTTKSLEVWHLYLGGIVTGVFQSFQWPAYSAAISTLVSKDQYGKANGILSLAESASGIAAPILAGALIGIIGIGNMMLIDIATFIFALATLLVIYIPPPKTSEKSQESPQSIWKDSVFGFNYIMRRPGLLSIQLILLGWNMVANFSNVILSPMILARTGGDAAILGTVLSVSSIGMLLGGLTMSFWGGPKQHIHGVLVGCIFGSIFGLLVMGLGRSLLIWAIASFFGLFFSPVINSSNQAIWQAKVPPAIQGRVFAARRLIASLAIPFAFLTSGPIADYIFEPAMRTDSILAKTFGNLVGTGPGSGMALMMILAGTLGMTIGLTSYFFPMIRTVELTLPDHDQVSVQQGYDKVGND